jgi:hypothetical protein
MRLLGVDELGAENAWRSRPPAASSVAGRWHQLNSAPTHLLTTIKLFIASSIVNTRIAIASFELYFYSITKNVIIIYFISSIFIVHPCFNLIYYFNV